MSACEQLAADASAGVAPALRAVDCLAGEMTAATFGRLFGEHGAMAPVLTILLTLYIAFFAISLLTGRSSLSISALTPRMLTLGLVLTFATSWIAYQGVMWNLAVGGPDWIASSLMGADGSATQIFGDRIDVVFNAIAQVAETSGGSGGQAGAGSAAAAAQGMFTPSSVMWLGALMLLLGTVGILLTARIALAVLMALGPIFVVMALFSGTRGLTAGWLRGVALTALTPLFVVLGGGITLELLVPILQELTQTAGEVDGRAAMALFLVAAVHLALMGMVLKVAGTLVSNWDVFGLGKSDKTPSADAGMVAYGAAMANAAAGVAPVGAAAAPATAPRRAAVVTAASAAAMADAGPAGEAPARAGERRTVVTQVVGGGIEPMAPRGEARARGIGSRFRNASNDTGKRQSQEMIR
ncbi:type IV secretion system protein [Novosphingobium album (ex Liu et al. 2023)]|uniref:Type IV secretion system protein n=1 Tax=Novosphingobium album (ex Liu et al. 2023) TaxID=3031130 RepID=A0ABT5WJP9_9SPHN|nr:type IV secretion system protein [Novosphingobium album (ex Liu et al. 2023)]MDE8650144.1 type IV secretion system protein [Novosphingobium album (ex Liu et al. 2023)]